MSLPTVQPEWDPTRFHKLWAELKFRRKAIFRLYPDAKMRSSHGPFWDMSGPAVAHVVIGESVHYDHEMTLLLREIDKASPPCKDDEGAKNTKPWPQHDHPIIQQNQYLDLLVSCACDAETWERDDVQDIYAKMFNREPLDRIVEALEAGL